MKSGKVTPRLLPTLTQVVKPEVRDPIPDFSSIVDAVMDRVMPMMEKRIGAMLDQAVREKMRMERDNLRADVETVLREFEFDSLATTKNR